MSDYIITRSQARAFDLRWYFTGHPCPAGHVTWRLVSSRGCRDCMARRLKRLVSERPDHFRAQGRFYYRKHRDKRAAADRARYPIEAERRKLRAKAWQRRNPGMLRYFCARRRARLLQATPPWLTRNQKRLIRAIYIEAAARGGDWHVDHIVPLRGKGVCGLNVPWNLQIISAAENRAKGNSYDPSGGILRVDGASVIDR